MKINIGLTQESLSAAAHELSHVLADEYVLYTKTRNAHWNIEGPHFHTMHVFFEAQYHALDDIMDSVAGRIRTLGHYAPATLQSFLNLTHFTEQRREKNDSAGFIKELLADHESLIANLRDLTTLFAGKMNDIGTSDFVTGLLETHEKMAWMLRAHL